MDTVVVTGSVSMLFAGLRSILPWQYRVSQIDLRALWLQVLWLVYRPDRVLIICSISAVIFVQSLKHVSHDSPTA